MPATGLLEAIYPLSLEHPAHSGEAERSQIFLRRPRSAVAAPESSTVPTRDVA